MDESEAKISKNLKSH
jgi:hypothetical protein